MTRTRACPPEVRRGRLRKATQFLDAAHLVWDFAAEDDIADAYITLCVHAGIAAADVICCARLGEHSQTENPNEAAAHQLGMNVKSGYSHPRSGPTERRHTRDLQVWMPRTPLDGPKTHRACSQAGDGPSAARAARSEMR